MTGGIDDLINYRIDRAFETIKEAEAMIENEFWNASCEDRTGIKGICKVFL